MAGFDRITVRSPRPFDVVGDSFILCGLGRAIEGVIGTAVLTDKNGAVLAEVVADARAQQRILVHAVRLSGRGGCARHAGGCADRRGRQPKRVAGERLSRHGAVDLRARPAGRFLCGIPGAQGGRRRHPVRYRAGRLRRCQPVAAALRRQ